MTIKRGNKIDKCEIQAIKTKNRQNRSSSQRKVDMALAFEMRFGDQACSIREIAAYFDVDKMAIQRALEPYNKLVSSTATIAQNAKIYQDRKSDMLDTAELKLLAETMDNEKIEDASLNNVAYALNIIANMNKLEKGQATSNISYMDMSASLEEIRNERKQLMEHLNIVDDDVPTAEYEAMTPDNDQPNNE